MNLKKTVKLSTIFLLINGILLINPILSNFAESLPGFEQNFDGEIKAPQKKDSRKEFKKEAFQLGQPCCFLNCIGFIPTLNVLDSYSDMFKAIKLGCIDQETKQSRSIKNAADLEFLTTLRSTQFSHTSFGYTLKRDKKYEGHREDDSRVAEFLANLILKKEKYEGQPLIDEYKANIPMFWNLKSIEQFRALSTYMLKIFEEEQFVPAKKTLLVLRIENDPSLQNLNQIDKEFVQAYFELFATNDEDVITFFNKNKDDILDYCRYITAADVLILDESIGQGIFRKLEDFCADFNRNRLGIKIGGIIGGIIVSSIIIKFLFENTNIIEEKSFLGQLFVKKPKPSSPPSA